MFDAITNFIVYLEESLEKSDDPVEIEEIRRILDTARRIRKERQGRRCA